MVFESIKQLYKLNSMKYLKYIKPTRLGIIIGIAVGVATKNIIVGIILILMFSIASHTKSPQVNAGI